MMEQSDVGNFVPFSGLRALDISSHLPITRHLIDGLASTAESAGEHRTLSDLIPQISATIGLLVETVSSLELELLATRRAAGGQFALQSELDDYLGYGEYDPTGGDGR
jgi:hypothetical protein